jgi:heat shock protein HslJ
MNVQKKLYCLLVCVLILTLAACVPQTGPSPEAGNQPASPENTLTPAGTGNSLVNTEWVLQSFGKLGAETPVLPGSTITLKFGPDGQATGSAGCNSYGSQYQVVDSTVMFTQTVSTLMACADQNVMDQEQEYHNALLSAGKFEIHDDRLTISYDNGQASLNFVKAPASPQTETPQTAMLPGLSCGDASCQAWIGGGEGHWLAAQSTHPWGDFLDSFPYEGVPV